MATARSYNKTIPVELSDKFLANYLSVTNARVCRYDVALLINPGRLRIVSSEGFLHGTPPHAPFLATN
jgi:hypothetical protein